MELNLGLLLCWIGIHRYKVIDISFGFGPAGSVKTVQCKICRIKKTKKGWNLNKAEQQRMLTLMLAENL